ncbi:MAG: energy transducer TonB [Desulforegulaceae bacterium]|jgi:protein TonB|nr:energy transducer TonB [Desulforegulaceae bacterium]
MEEKIFNQNILKGLLLAVFANIIILIILTQLIEGKMNSPEDKLFTGVMIQNVKLRPEVPKPEEIEKKEPENEEKKEVVKPQNNKLYTPNKQFEFEMPSFDLNLNLKSTGFSVPINQLSSTHSAGSMISLDELDKIPVPKFKKPPVYPYRAKRMGIEGEVSISFIVHENGMVSDIKILKANPEGVFEQSVIDAVSSWKYSPGELMGENVKTLVTTNVVFKLEE